MKKIFVLISLIIISPAFGELISDFSNLCGVPGYHRIYAVPTTFTCAAGYFLPANSTTCHACPDGFTCAGGDFFFNETTAQGIVRNSNYLSNLSNEHKTCSSDSPRRMYAVTKSFTCEEGYFLPANAMRCFECPDGFTCAGGTFHYNATLAQGIVFSGNVLPVDAHNTCASNMNHVLNGSFSPNTIGITYYSNGEQYDTGSCVYDDVITLPDAPTRAGYIFNGWRVVSQ